MALPFQVLLEAVEAAQEFGCLGILSYVMHLPTFRP